jgi:hypothetical protein
MAAFFARLPTAIAAALGGAGRSLIGFSWHQTLG